MGVGIETFDDNGSLRTRMDRSYGRVIGSVTITLPLGYANRFQRGTVTNDGFLLGKPFAFFQPGRATLPTQGGATSYCVIVPRVSFAGNVLTWEYVRDSSTDFANSVFNDGPVDGVLYYGVI